MTMIRISWFVLLAASSGGVFAQIDFSERRPAPGNLRFTWIHGSLSAKANTDVRVQVHRYNEHTYILRQNPAVHWEAPFMYLLMGNTRAVLFDAGATAEEVYFPLKQVVDRVLHRWQQANQIQLEELLVVPLGSESFQTAGLSQFDAWPLARTVEPVLGERRQLFGDDWPEAGLLDLGGRTLSVLPAPGIDAHAVVVYDPWTQVMLSGNSLYPGRLVVRDFSAFQNTLETLLAFSEEHPVVAFWGGRIEMSSEPGLDYLLRSNYRPNERALPLDLAALTDALGILRLMNGAKDIHIHDDFIVMHGVGRGARAYGWPVYIPEQFRKDNTR